MSRKALLICVQVLGALPIGAYPVIVIFSLVSFGKMESWFQTVFMVGSVVFPIVWGVLFWLSWRSYGKGRFWLALLLSTPPAIPTVAVGAFLVFGMGWEILMGPRRQQAWEAERLVTEDLFRVMGAQYAYKARNDGLHGDLACLAEPRPCLPGYTGPPFIDKAFIAPERNGYVRMFHPGPRGDASAQGFTRYAYTALPLKRGGKAPAFCGDDTGQLRRTSGGEPGVDGGRCSSGELLLSPLPPPAEPRRPSRLTASADASARGRAAARREPPREQAVRRLEELGYKDLDAGGLVKAASEGKTEAVELFLAAGVPIDAPRYHLADQVPPLTGHTALLAAMDSGYLDTAARLLQAGASVKVKDQNTTDGNRNRTPLIMLARYCQEAALASAFIEAGADVNASTATGWTALQAAENGHCPEVASILRKAGARQ